MTGALRESARMTGALRESARMTGALRESARLVAAGTRREVSGGAARTRLGGATTGPSVTVCRSRTAGLAAVCREADVLVSAAAAALTRCPAAWGR